MADADLDEQPDGAGATRSCISMTDAREAMRSWLKSEIESWRKHGQRQALLAAREASGARGLTWGPEHHLGATANRDAQQGAPRLARSVCLFAAARFYQHGHYVDFQNSEGLRHDTRPARCGLVRTLLPFIRQVPVTIRCSLPRRRNGERQRPSSAAQPSAGAVEKSTERCTTGPVLCARAGVAREPQIVTIRG